MMNKCFVVLVVAMLATCLAAPGSAATAVSHFSMGEADLPFGLGLDDSLGSNDMDTVTQDGGAGYATGPASPAPGSTASVDFDGLTRYEVGNFITSGTTGLGYTIEAWVNPDLDAEGDAGDIILSDGHGGAGAVIFQADNPAGGTGFGLAMGGAGGFWNVGPTVITPGRWYHLEFTRDLAGAVSLLVDGVDQGLADPGIGTLAWAPVAAIGDQGSGGFGFDGQIDAVSFSVIPEPAGLILVVVGALGLLAARRRK